MLCLIRDGQKMPSLYKGKFYALNNSNWDYVK